MTARRDVVARLVALTGLLARGEADGNARRFVAEQPWHTCDVIVTGLDLAASSRYEVFNLDMDATARRRDDTLVAPCIGVAEALAKYG